MASIRKEIAALNLLGALPTEDGTDPALIQKYEELYRRIIRPITDEEARVLVKLFGSDGCFGLASSLVHLIETAPGWPLEDCLHNLDNEWIMALRNRAIRGGLLPVDAGFGKNL
ncbi:hypothetical protein [Methylovulum psychrotolerans]|uniref:Uncharacterized protein n=1 Tax=Methylovulum psychrotolerans TaxID=1704499 RepID=A0A2S5CHU4_9GAMM|nr:hypothetical protein [Methylovulum psychrotolerans]POZ50376.1 hypothetical protein AADEFJLK_03788 [Methylovulum psychrotolerans]